MEHDQDPETFPEHRVTGEHPLEGGQTDAVSEAQEIASGESSTSRENDSFVIVFPDGTKTIEAFADSGGYPKRGEEVSPGWIANHVLTNDLSVNGEQVNVEVRVVARADFLAQ